MMTPEARLDRLERVAILLFRAGYRARKLFREQLREQERMISHTFDLQIANDEMFAQNEERFARNEKRVSRLVESQANTDRKLNSLTEIIERRGLSHEPG